MFIIDPIASLTVVAGVFIYFACKGNGKRETLPPNKMSDGQDFGEWYRNLCEMNRKRNEERLEEMHYNKWLLDHRQN